MTISPDELFKQMKNERKQEKLKRVQDTNPTELVNQERENYFETPAVYYFPFDRPGLEKPW